MNRVVAPELLDVDAGSPREISDSLLDLRMFNRWFGGARIVSKLLERVADRNGLNELTWLDVAGASGDVAAMTEHRLAARGRRLLPTILDRSPKHLTSGYPSTCGDALALPFQNNSFDVVGSSLFVHHLGPEEIVDFARESLRVARYAIIIHDLFRHPLHLALSYLGFPLYRSRLTRHDAPVSVRRAYTSEELRTLLGRAVEASKIEIKTYYLFRIGALVWK